MSCLCVIGNQWSPVTIEKRSVNKLCLITEYGQYMQQIHTSVRHLYNDHISNFSLSTDKVDERLKQTLYRTIYISHGYN